MRWIILILLYLLVDIYAYQAFRIFTRNGWFGIAYFAVSALVIANLLPVQSACTIRRTGRRSRVCYRDFPGIFLFPNCWWRY